MGLSDHDKMTGVDVHVPHSFEFANAAARTSSTGYIATDVKKWALDIDTMKYFVLTNHSPITWQAVS